MTSPTILDCLGAIWLWLYAFLVLGKPIDQLAEGNGLVFVEAILIDVDEAIPDGGLCSVDVVAPLPEALHLERYIQVFLILPRVIRIELFRILPVFFRYSSRARSTHR